MTGALLRARALAARGEDAAALQDYLAALRDHPGDFAVLSEFAALAHGRQFRAAARTACEQAVRCHPDNPLAHSNLANLLHEAGDPAAARHHYDAALALDAGFAPAHRGLARLLDAQADPAATAHRRLGFAAHAVATLPYRGTGTAAAILLLVAAAGGNVPTHHWIDDRRHAVTVLHADFHDPAQPLPPHDLIVNAIGEADLCAAALAGAAAIVARSTAPVINPPDGVRATGRADNARRLAGIAGLRPPRIEVLARRDLAAAARLGFPLLLRTPGCHTGRNFHLVAGPGDLAPTAAALPGDELLAIEYLDARGADGMARKYRVMFVDGTAYPLHLAIAADWKVHYFTADMAASAAHRAEEQRFLADMPGVLGRRAMAALAGLAATLGLDYAGADFALAADGSLLLFEANATMVVYPPGPEPIWDYRRPAVDAILAALERMLARRLARG